MERELTTRQWQVLEEIRRGATDREIAARLGIALATVRKHVHDILQRTGTVDRTGAARRVVRSSP